MDVGSLLVADPQSAKLVQPGKGPFHDPSPSAQSAAVFSVAHREQRQNASVTQALPDRFRVIPAVAEHIIRSMAWAPPDALQRRNGINEHQRLLRVVTVGSSDLNG